MKRKRRPPPLPPSSFPALGNLHEWLLSLPWVVERPANTTTPGVRYFAVDCEPLGRRQLWIVTGLPISGDDGTGVAVVLPAEAVPDVERAGWGRADAPMPAGTVLLRMADLSVDTRVEALALSAYTFALA